MVLVRAIEDIPEEVSKLKCKICGEEIEDEAEGMDGCHRDCLADGDGDLAPDISQAIPIDD